MLCCGMRKSARVFSRSILYFVCTRNKSALVEFLRKAPYLPSMHVSLLIGWVLALLPAHGVGSLCWTLAGNMRSEDKKDASVVFVLQLRAAVDSSNYAAYFRMYKGA